jgi:hypothetical protein
MTVPGGTSRGADALAHTTLRIDAATPERAVVDLLCALRRVPGVLLADANAARDRATVAHDSGVANAAMLAAATRVGVRASIVHDIAEAGVLAGSVTEKTHLLLRRLLGVWTVAVLSLAVFAVVAPGAKPWFLPVYACAIGVYFALQVLSTRRIT